MKAKKEFDPEDYLNKLKEKLYDEALCLVIRSRRAIPKEHRDALWARVNNVEILFPVSEMEELAVRDDK